MDIEPEAFYEPVLVLSVPGSGTHFTRYWLDKALGFEDVNYRRAKAERLPFRSSFSIHSFIPQLGEFAGNKAVVPLRPPNKTYITRAHHDRSRERVMRHIVESWSRLIEHWKLFDTVFLPIETDDREYTMTKVLHRLGAPLVDADAHRRIINEWPKQNSQEEKQGPNQTDDYRELDFANVWYEETMHRYRRERQKNSLTGDSHE